MPIRRALYTLSSKMTEIRKAALVPSKEIKVKLMEKKTLKTSKNAIFSVIIGVAG